MPVTRLEPPRGGEEHEFSNGWVAELRIPGVWQMIRSGVLDPKEADAYGLASVGRLEDAAMAARITDKLLVQSFVAPKVTTDRDQVAYDADPQVIHVDDVPDVVIGELLELAFGGGAEVDAFPDEPDGEDGGGNGAGVADDAEPAVGNGAGDDGGAARGRKPGRARRAAEVG